MNYTIMTLEDVQGDLRVKYGKDGNRYFVTLHNKELEDYTFKYFEKIDEAIELFCKYAEAIATGCYSYEERKSWIE